MDAKKATEYDETAAVRWDCIVNYQRGKGRYVLTTGLCSRKYRSDDVQVLTVCIEEDHALGLCSYYAIFDTKRGIFCREGR